MATINKRLQDTLASNRKLKDQAKLDINKIKEQQDKIHALQTQLSQEEAKVKNWETMQMNGYTAVAINDGYITEAVTVPPYSTFTYTQDIPTQMYTPLYKKYPFVKLNKQGKMVFDSQKYRKFRGVV